MDIRDKIKKLLALATSPNENEAKAALLKAKELMMANKLTEADFDKAEPTMAHVEVPDVKWTTDSGRSWMADLCRVICENYLCVAAWVHPEKSRTYSLMVTGLKDDVDTCVDVVKYAVNFVMRRTLEIARRKPGTDLKTVERSYASGFIAGLELLYDLQKDEHPEWGLVEVRDQKVEDYKNNLSTRNVRTRTSGFDALAHLKGRNDGMAFNPAGVLPQTD